MTTGGKGESTCKKEGKGHILRRKILSELGQKVNRSVVNYFALVLLL